MDTTETVVGLSGAASAVNALRWAVEHCAHTGSPVRVVHAWELPPDEHLLPLPPRGGGAAARAMAESWVAQALGQAPASSLVLDVVEGPAGPVLVECSRHAAMLVVGTRRHAGLRRVLAGSASHYCLTNAVCPVVAVPLPAYGRVPAPRHHEPVGASTPLS